MASLEDLAVSAFINILSAIGFLLAFAVLRVQPINGRVYYPKWYINGGRSSPRGSANGVLRFVSFNIWSYVVSFLGWMPQALKMSQAEIIQHAGLDSAIYLRIYILGLKIFVPVTVAALLVLIPVNVSGGTLLDLKKEIVFSDIDKLSISNVSPGSERFWVHLVMAYLFTLWSCYMLYIEYDNIAFMRLHFLASQPRRVEQFSVVVRNIPKIPGHSISETVDHFFRKNHPDHYLGHQVVYNANRYAKLVRQKEKLQNWLDYNQLKFERHPHKRPSRNNRFLGLCGERVDAIDDYTRRIHMLDKRIASEHQRILKEPKAILPVAFVTFDSRWGAAVCAQTQQSKNPTQWLTEWAPEPCDVYWKNLAIPFVSLSIRRLLISISVFALVFFYMIPITFVQSLANLEGLEKVAPFLRRVIELKLIKSFLQGFLPGLALKIFLYILPTVLMIMSKVEGYLSLSTLERRAAAKYYYFMLVNVFLGSIIAGTAFEQLYSFLHQPPTDIPRTIGVSIPMKATFFMTYIMVDGWAGVAGEILRLKPFVLYHLKNMFIVKTDSDRQKAMDPGSIGLPENLPTLQLYFLLGLVYAVITPLLLPFILVFFIFAFVVYRNQIINVYNQEYESAGAFWPHVHTRIIGSLLISQLLLLGLLSTKKAAHSTPLLIILPVLTIWFHMYCKRRFEPAFRKYPLEEAMEKDTIEKASEPNLNLKAFLADAYLHPIFQIFEEDEEMGEIRVDKSRIQPSSTSSPSSPQYEYGHDSPTHYEYDHISPLQHVYHHDISSFD
ncbi:DNA-directed RNA polymerase III subunit RPC2 [Apostasia shenzhenica]|uniref:DNA-directed RNA polymerase III subunit RPC2 n=1 Tax=Apostasia shenzhenica TaxID=1088818 RepID=A0A2I0ABU1_9ASPA|nr:DNA-directed RNA polymerase III subunit RPC2 [Apostasia shenzhenica]